MLGYLQLINNFAISSINQYSEVIVRVLSLDKAKIMRLSSPFLTINKYLFVIRSISINIRFQVQQAMSYQLVDLWYI